MPIGLDKVVIIFGLAGVGKSTLAENLGAALGLRVIHPSGIMRDLMSGNDANLSKTKSNDGFWETDRGSKMLADRLQSEKPIDVHVNNLLLDEVKKGELVIDSWTLPWLTEKGLKIHLKAPLEVRAQRAAQRCGQSKQMMREKIAKKDSDSRALFQRLYAFDIMKDHDVFHHTVQTEHLDARQVLERVLDLCR